MTGTRAVAAAAAWGMFLFGLATALLGAVLPILATRLAFNLSEAGTLFLVLNLGVFLCVFGLGRWIDKRGVKGPMVAGPLLVASALALIPVAPDFRSLTGSALLLGLGGGALNVATNTLVADLYTHPREKNSALNWLGIFFGLGGLLIPVGLGTLLNREGFAPVLLLGTALGLGAAMYSMQLVFPPAKHARPRPRPGLGHTGVLVSTGALLFFQSGVEVILSGYTAMYLVHQLGLAANVAAWGLTVLWLAVIGARLVLVRLTLHVSGHRIVLASAGATFTGCALLLEAHTTVAAFAALSLVGAGLAGIFPTVLGMTSALFRESSGTVFGLLLTVSRTGAMVLPYAAGHAGERFGIRAVFWMVLAATVTIAGFEFARQPRAAEVRPSGGV